LKAKNGGSQKQVVEPTVSKPVAKPEIVAKPQMVAKPTVSKPVHLKT